MSAIIGNLNRSLSRRLLLGQVGSAGLALATAPARAQTAESAGADASRLRRGGAQDDPILQGAYRGRRCCSHRRLSGADEGSRQLIRDTLIPAVI